MTKGTQRRAPDSHRPAFLAALLLAATLILAAAGSAAGQGPAGETSPADGPQPGVTPAAQATSVLPSQMKFRLDSQIGGSAYAAVVDGDIAYVGNGRRVTVVNVSDPAHPAAPVFFGCLRTQGQTQSVALANGRVYVADDYTGLTIAEGIRPLWLPMIGRGFGQP